MPRSALPCSISPPHTDGTDAGHMAADKVRELMRAVGIKSLKEQGFSREEVLACAEGAVNKNWFVICALKKVTVEVMRKELGKMYDNYQ